MEVKVDKKISINNSFNILVTFLLGLFLIAVAGIACAEDVKPIANAETSATKEIKYPDVWGRDLGEYRDISNIDDNPYTFSRMEDIDVYKFPDGEIGFLFLSKIPSDEKKFKNIDYTKYMNDPEWLKLVNKQEYTLVKFFSGKVEKILYKEVEDFRKKNKDSKFYSNNYPEFKNKIHLANFSYDSKCAGDLTAPFEFFDHNKKFAEYYLFYKSKDIFREDYQGEYCEDFGLLDWYGDFYYRQIFSPYISNFIILNDDSFLVYVNNFIIRFKKDFTTKFPLEKTDIIVFKQEEMQEFWDNLKRIKETTKVGISNKQLEHNFLVSFIEKKIVERKKEIKK